MKYFIIYILTGFFYNNLILAQQSTLVEVDLVKVEQLNQTIPVIGSLRSKKITNIMAAVPGKIDEVIVEEGDFVKKVNY